MRISRTGLAALAATSLAFASAGAAQAKVEIFNLDVNGCSSTCFANHVTSIGTVTVTEEANGSLKFVVDLGAPNVLAPKETAETVLFNANGNQQHHAFAFNLDLTGASITGLSDTSTKTGFKVDSGSVTQAGFGTFKYGIDYKGTNGQGHTDNILSFFVSKLNTTLKLTDLQSLAFGQGSTAKKIYMVADVYGNGNTGNVGAEDGGSAAPEPGTWAMLLLGVGAIGAMARRRRAMAVA